MGGVMIQCRACHYEAKDVADLALHIESKHGFNWQEARAKAMQVAGTDYTEDELAFGKDVWVYCRQHMKPHKTGWCSVGAHDKVGLGVTNAKMAERKCIEWGFELSGRRYYAPQD